MLIGLTMIDFGHFNNPMISEKSQRQSSALSFSEKRHGGSNIQLTPIWEHVVRTQSLPNDIDIHTTFYEFSERLKDPEWEVRQHALRVLIDMIPVMNLDYLDHSMSIILTDLVYNLGHPAPAVRKGALESLRVYLTHSRNSEEVLQTIAYEGIENISDQNLQGNITVGLILSLPSLVIPYQSNGQVIEYPSVEYIIRLLVRKLVQITFQEVTMRTLAKLREIVGDELFEKYLDSIEQFDKMDFFLLCQVYNIDLNHNLAKLGYYQPNDIVANKNILLESNFVPQTQEFLFPSTPLKTVSHNIIEKLTAAENDQQNGTVILKTEIQLDSETAVTMTILEEKENLELDNSEQDSDNDDSYELTHSYNENNSGVVKVFPDSDFEESIDYSYPPRTPRRVRFGGEIVKMRTPDSDTAQPTSDDETTSNDKVIEITFTEHNNSSDESLVFRSHIPIPITPATKIPQIKVNICPKRKAVSEPTSPVKEKPTKVAHKSVYQSTPDLTKQYLMNQPENDKKNNFLKPKASTSAGVRKSRRADNVYSPIPIHEEVELLHNLQATNRKCFSSPANPEQRSVEISEKSSLDDKKIVVPTISLDDSLTSSSGESVQGSIDRTSWEELGLISDNVLADIHNPDDWTARVKGREELLQAFRCRDVLNGIESRAASFIHFLFTSDKHPGVLEVTQSILYLIVDNFTVETLKSRLPQLVAGISRLGGPASIRLAVQLMQKLTPATVAEQFVNNHLITGRNSRVKENALQIVIYTLLKFPSTEFNVATLSSRVLVALKDKRRRVRHAALETLAVLGQIGLMDVVLDACLTTLNNMDCDQKETILAAIRTRLVRRQLPIANEEFVVTYAPLTDSRGADIDWIFAGTGSISPSSAKQCASAIYRNKLHSAEPIFYHTTNTDSYKNPWSETTSANDMIRPKTTNSKDEIRTINVHPTEIWALDYNKPLKPEYDYSQDHSNKRWEYHHSAIPVPTHQGTKVRYSSQRNGLRNKIPSAPLSSCNQSRPISETSNDLPRQAYSSSGTETRNDSYINQQTFLPPINNSLKTNSYKSQNYIASSQTESLQSDNEITVIRPTSVSNTSKAPDNEDSSAYVTSEQETSFDSASPVRSVNKLPSDSDFEIDEVDQQDTSSFVGKDSVSDGYKSASSSGKLSNRIIVLDEGGDETEDEADNNLVIKRENVSSAPIQILLNDNNTSLNSNDEEIADVKAQTIPKVKSLPGSIVNLNDEIDLSASAPSIIEPARRLLIRQQRNAKVTADRLLNRTPRTRPTKEAIQASILEKPFDKPKEAFHSTINQLENTNWEITVNGLQSLTRLIRHHPEIIDNQMHPVAVLLAKHIRNLRSQVARSACSVASEMFTTPKKALEMEMEEIAAPLLHRTADTNKFLRADANAALDSMCTNMSPIRVINILSARGAMHQNAVVRCATSRLISKLVERLGNERIFTFPREVRDRVLVTSAKLLTEGSLDTRNHAKQIFRILMKHPQFQKILMEVVPASTLRSISKTLQNIK